MTSSALLIMRLNVIIVTKWNAGSTCLSTAKTLGLSDRGLPCFPSYTMSWKCGSGTWSSKLSILVETTRNSGSNNLSWSTHMQYARLAKSLYEDYLSCLQAPSHFPMQASIKPFPSIQASKQAQHPMSSKQAVDYQAWHLLACAWPFCVPSKQASQRVETK